MLNQHRVDVLFDSIVRVIGAARFIRNAAPQVAAAMFVVACGAVHFAPVGDAFDESSALVAESGENDAAEAAPASLMSVMASTGAALFHPAPRTAQRAAVTRGAAMSVEQHNIARFIASRYRIALDQTQEFVEYAYRTAKDLKLDPWLILAVISVESSFDPTAESNRGAKGLMQVLTRVHADKFVPFGGVAAAFDPLANMRVGAQILKEYMARDGTVETALKGYVGAALLPHDDGYGAKVLSERERIAAVAAGRNPVEAPVVARAVRKPAPAVVEAVAEPVLVPVAQHCRVRTQDQAPLRSACHVRRPSPRRGDEEAAASPETDSKPG